jgi:hypothetical protein
VSSYLSDAGNFVAIFLLIYKYISEEEFAIVNKLLNEVRAMLINFIKFLRKGEG